MDFSSVIDKIMPEVRNGADEPFIIYHDKDGGWHGDFTQNQYGDTFDWVEDVKEQDPLALTFKGSDFAKGSFPYVYDKILTARLRVEYDAEHSDLDSDSRFSALMEFIEDNIGEFTHEATDYIARYDRPLKVLNDMLPFSLKDNGGGTYDESRADEAIDFIENRIADLNSRDNDEVKAGYSDKHSIDGYEEMYSIQINGRTLFIGENVNAENRYMVCEDRWDNALGANENVYKGITNDFLEAIGEYTKNVQYYINCAKSDRELRKNMYGIEPVILAAADCVPRGMDKNLAGKVIIIKHEALAPEKQTSDYQLKIAMGGFGCAPNSRGNAVYCKDLFSGTERRFERYDVLGVADLERLPEWAKKKLAALDTPEEAQVNMPPQKEKKPSLLGKLDDNKQKVKRSKADRADKPVTKKQGDLEVD